jgi:hypothetical protein
MMKVYLEGIDEAIAQDKANRAKKGYVVERKADKREIYTVFGSLEFNRRYSKNQPKSQGIGHGNYTPSANHRPS